MIEANESITGSVSGTETLNGGLNNGVYVASESDPTVPTWVKKITQEDLDRWNQGGADLSDYATKDYVNKAIANGVTNALGGEY